MKQFEEAFYALTGHKPMLWQSRLFERFTTSSVPSLCDIPTGLGKTSVMAIWLLALARQAMLGAPSLPRRLVYVVNRRTVVDQASEEAASYQLALRDGSSGALHEIRCALLRMCVDPQDSASPLAISTLRGELADNRAWQADPCRATIIVGTVDLIGSRLLFSGYRSGWKMRAFDAGLVGQDAFLVHDEAHLSPAFGALGREVARVQRDGGEALRAIRVLELSATQRAGDSSDVFSLTANEKTEPLAARRIEAAKSLRIHDLLETDGDLPSKLAEIAFRHRDAKARVLVYVRLPDYAQAVAAALREKVGGERVALLTGTLRGYERDALGTDNAVYRTFCADDRRPPVTATVYLVATSAGEVGANLDADHLVCDVTTLDSMIQRLGRVNRLGRDESEFVAQVDAVFEAWHPGKKTKSSGKENVIKPAFEVARDETIGILRDLPDRGDGYDVSPHALGAMLETPAAQRVFAPEAPRVPCTDVLLDAWALTSIREALPGRPAVHPFLHGVESDPPETVVAWRDEVTDLVALAHSSASDVIEWLDAHRLLSHETLTDSPGRVAKVLMILAKQQTRSGGRLDPLVVPTFGDPFVLAQPDLSQDTADAKDLARRIGGAIVLLHPTAGGLDDAGMLAEPHGGTAVVDVADVRSDPARARLRVRLWRNEDGDWIAHILGGGDPESTIKARTLAAAIQQLGAKLRQANKPSIEKMRLVLDEDDDGPTAALVSFGVPRQLDTAFDASSAAAIEQSLAEHLDAAGQAARRVARRVGLDEETTLALVAAAQWHDVGKNRAVWQRAVGNQDVSNPLAKTSHGRFDYSICSGYRHELGSLLDAALDSEIAAMPERDLVLHLIASHHARSRPHFPESAWDPAATDEQNRAAVADAIRRYARLQRRFGRWGLAWLEALMKCADVVATLRGPAVKELPE